MQEEEQHLDTFTKIFNIIEDRKEAHSADYLFDADSSRYLTVLAESHVFPQQDKVQSVIAELNKRQSRFCKTTITGGKRLDSSL